MKISESLPYWISTKRSETSVIQTDINPNSSNPDYSSIKKSTPHNIVTCHSD
jgi:hypothetical protein